MKGLRVKIISTLIAVLCIAPIIKAEDAVMAVYQSQGSELATHVRLSDKKWALLFDYADSLNYTFIRVQRVAPPPPDIAAYSSKVTLGKTTNGQETILESKIVDHQNKEFSLSLTVDSYKAVLRAGDGTKVNFNNLKPQLPATSKVAIRTDKPLGNTTVYCSIKQYAEPKFGRFTSLDDLDRYLSQSTDALEGKYTFFDNDIHDGNLVRIANSYILALVKADREDATAYDLLYLGVNADGYKDPTVRATYYQWQPLEVKATLKPTPFDNDFNLTWLDWNREPITDRASAHALFPDLKPGYHPVFMVITFPLLQATLRFVRLSETKPKRKLNLSDN